MVILVPLLFVETLPERGLFKALMLAPVPMAPPAPPPPMIAKRIPRAAVVARKFDPAVLVSPVVVPKEVAIISEAPALQADVVVGGVPGGIPGVAWGRGDWVVWRRAGGGCAAASSAAEGCGGGA